VALKASYLLNILSSRAFHKFEQSKFANGGSILGYSQFTVTTTQLPLKMTLDLKVVTVESKIIILIH